MFLLRVSKDRAFPRQIKPIHSLIMLEKLSHPFLFNLGTKLLQDYQATHGPEEGEEKAAATELSVLPVHPGLCV